MKKNFKLLLCLFILLGSLMSVSAKTEYRLGYYRNAYLEFQIPEGYHVSESGDDHWVYLENGNWNEGITVHYSPTGAGDPWNVTPAVEIVRLEPFKMGNYVWGGLDALLESGEHDLILTADVEYSQVAVMTLLSLDDPALQTVMQTMIVHDGIETPDWLAIDKRGNLVINLNKEDRTDKWFFDGSYSVGDVTYLGPKTKTTGTTQTEVYGFKGNGACYLSFIYASHLKKFDRVTASVTVKVENGKVVAILDAELNKSKRNTLIPSLELKNN